MVNWGARVERCAYCHDRALCATLVTLVPTFKLFVCALCLRAIAAGVEMAMRRQAASAATP